MQRTILIALGLATLLVAPDAAHAYCARPNIAYEITKHFPTHEIPVWVSTGSNSSVELLGLPPSAFARIVLEVIARHNEAVAVPKLYFAGFTDRSLSAEGIAYDGWESGIVVHSFDCALLSPENVEGENPPFSAAELCHANTSSKKACRTLWNSDALTVSVNLVPPSCEYSVYQSDWSLDGSTADDIAEVLLHEFGHALGLDHSDTLEQDCLASGYLHGNDPGPNQGAMWSVTSGNLALHRHWRRDDLDGLAALYGSYDLEREFAYWIDDAFPGEPEIGDDVQSLAGYPVVQTPALGDAPSGEAQPIVLVDPTRRVQFARLAADGSVTEAPAAIGGGALEDEGRSEWSWFGIYRADRVARPGPTTPGPTIPGLI